ncbi:MAG: 2-succinyl-5-enolpyruvyl-6-hydroxy-3-cyclohexene-1-carboxylic-acid synthase [Roseivirga sp.]|nr:2-succinyl-5-enolpyruvyl-6-hydroxy-3-cyclohexene-1-carboxylic-acid synthase [Roseivirga sp.]
MILEHINDIAAICAGHGIQTAIISPGSRSAPLTLAFARHPALETKVISDERAAAFIALGMAQQQQKPVALICTSGSAAFNYAPAVAEAYFQEVPLLVLTADRPPEWINQYDGQTIQQENIYGKHVKASFSYPDNPNQPDIAWHGNRIVNEALLQCSAEPKGPVHINVPLREPFYPEANEKTLFREVRPIKRPAPQAVLSDENWKALTETWQLAHRRLIIGGQLTDTEDLVQALNSFSNKHHSPVVSDIISNLHGLQNAILHQDAFLCPENDKENVGLIPDLLITFGKSNISKNLKRFIRKHKPAHHWHIQPHERYQDTFQSLTRIIPMEPDAFFTAFHERLQDQPTSSAYLNEWLERDRKKRANVHSFFQSQPFGEFETVNEVMSALPADSQLHLANSMSVRYANFVGLRGRSDVKVFCNRGTSGIDGSNSTAVGAALAQDQLITLITGDMAFFYDRNAFWHNYPIHNLRIVLLNNHAGGIFRMIKGPSDQPELAEYFETEQLLTAENTAKDFGMEYKKVGDREELGKALADFYQPGPTAKILEVETDSAQNTAIFKAYKAL